MQHTKPLQKRECPVASGEFYVEFYGALTGRPSKRWKGKFYISLRFRPVSILLWSLLDLDFSVSFFDFLVNFVGNLPAIFLCTFVRSQFYRGRCWIWISQWFFGFLRKFYVEFHNDFCWGFLGNFLSDFFLLHFSALSPDLNSIAVTAGQLLLMHSLNTAFGCSQHWIGVWFCICQTQPTRPCNICWGQCLGQDSGDSFVIFSHLLKFWKEILKGRLVGRKIH